MKWSSRNYLKCNACDKKPFKIAENGDHCLKQHLRTKRHTFIMGEDDTDWPGILKKKEDLDPQKEDRFHVQREKFERNRILAKIPNMYTQWIEVNYCEYAYRFYCRLCQRYTETNQIKDLTRHMESEVHHEHFQQHLSDAKNGKGESAQQVNSFK